MTRWQQGLLTLVAVLVFTPLVTGNSSGPQPNWHFITYHGWRYRSVYSLAQMRTRFDLPYRKEDHHLDNVHYTVTTNEFLGVQDTIHTGTYFSGEWDHGHEYRGRFATFISHPGGDDGNVAVEHAIDLDTGKHFKANLD